MKQKAPSDYRGLNKRDLVFLFSDPGETRTHGQWLKRPLLYQLSYRIEIFKISRNLVEKSIIENDLKKLPFEKIYFSI